MEDLGRLHSKEELIAMRQRIDAALAAMGDAGAPDNVDSHKLGTRACRMFMVSDGVRRLSKAQLDALTSAFEAWVEEAGQARTRRSRERVLIIYLLLRYTGAKLGEVLALDERKDFDFKRGLALIPDGAGTRDVPLPAEVLERIKEHVSRYQKDAGSERVFDLDQGFIRKKFYEQDKRSGLPRELLSPSVLRNSRAVELLQGGMPMRAVQALLGHAKADFTASYVTLADEDLSRITREYCNREFGVETSARNTFKGEVVKVEANSVVCEVTLKTASGYEVTALITNNSREKLGLAKGRPATAMVKATWVILEKADAPAPTSARNAFPGTVTGVTGDDVVVEVGGKLEDGTPVCALITRQSFDRLGIGKGDSFIFMFKAMAVIVS